MTEGVPAGPAPNSSSPGPVGAEIYRWDGTQWVVDGRLPRVSDDLNVSWLGGWFVSVPQSQPATVASPTTTRS